MQITLTWVCRECGQHQERLTDTSGFGFLMKDGTRSHVEDHPLECRACGHVSGNLGLAYRYDEENRPRREREERARRRRWRGQSR